MQTRQQQRKEARQFVAAQASKEKKTEAWLRTQALFARKAARQPAKAAAQAEAKKAREQSNARLVARRAKREERARSLWNESMGVENFLKGLAA